MPLATVFGPDGKQLLTPDGLPLEYYRQEEHRAFLSAQKAWWPVGKIAKRGIGPKWGRPPIGAEIRMEGEPWKRFEEVPVFDKDGVLVDTKLAWVDIAAKAEADDRAARVRAMAIRLGVPVPDWATKDVDPWVEAAATATMLKDDPLEKRLDAADAELHSAVVAVQAGEAILPSSTAAIPESAVTPPSRRRP